MLLVTGRTRHADPFARFIPRRDHKKARVKRWQTGITQARQSNPKASLGLRSANNIQRV